MEKVCGPYLLLLVFLGFFCHAERVDKTTECDGPCRFPKTIAQSRRHIRTVMKEHNIPGLTIALVDGQRVVWAEGFGYADKEKQTPVTTDTVMMIGSVSKFLTALMAMQLVDDATFSLNAPIGSYVNDFAMSSRFENQANGWTIRTMLDHHSGIPGDIYNGSFVSGSYWSGYTDWMINYFKDDYPLYPARTLASYCNSGFNLVGEAIGRHDGVDFTLAGQRRLFRPLKMTHSSFLPDNPMVVKNLATGYDPDGSPAPVAVVNMMATGGAFSRPLDMANIIKMIIADGTFAGAEFLSRNALAEIGRFTPGPLDLDSFFKPGLGLDSVDDPTLNYAGRTWLKNGSTGKFEALLEILPDQHLGAFVNINCANSQTFPVLRNVLQLAVEEKTGVKPPDPVQMPTPKEASWPRKKLDAVAGYYVTRTGVDRFVPAENGTLRHMKNSHGQAATHVDYRPHTNRRFFAPGHPGWQFEFKSINGHDVVTACGDDGSARTQLVYGGYAEGLYGVRYTPPAISEAWSKRCGTMWFANNLVYDDYPLTEGQISGWMLSESDGILSIEGISSATLAPVSDTVAYAAGLFTRGDGAVRITTDGDQEHLWFGGYCCTRHEDIRLLKPGKNATFSLTPHSNGLFRYQGQKGAFTSVVLNNNSEIRVFELETLAMLGRGTGSVSWQSQTTPALLILSSAETVAGKITTFVKH